MNKAEIGIIGGSGFYEFLTHGKWVDIKTLYGKSSDKIFLGEYKGRKIAFLPRHARGHKIPPHMINYRANIWAMKELGVKVIIAPSAVGSLQPNIKRGDFVLCDDFIDRTKGRKDTFFDGPKVVHISAADCYCRGLSKIAFKVFKNNKLKAHPEGTVVVIQGPRFSSKGESKWFTQMGWDVVNMTQCPEVVLAREAEICYLNISLVTDYDVGLIGKVKSVNIEGVIEVFNKNTEKLKKVILEIIGKIPKNYKCRQCHEALKGAEV
jgi:5'-methylthioadenosine phosphorylase